MSGTTLATAYFDELGACNTPQATAALEPTLQQHLEHARRQWPGIDLPAEAYVRQLARAARAAAAAGEAPRIEGLRTDDLYLAGACARGDETAIRRCDELVADELRRALKRLGLGEADVDAVRQALRTKLFVASPPALPYVATFSGQGRLASWIRVIAVHLALKRFRHRDRRRPLDEADLERMAAAPGLAPLSPEQLHLKQLYQAELRLAFREAIGTLTERQRELLRLHFIESQSIDRLGESYAVHRATAARWLAQAREALVSAVRREVVQRCRLSPDSYASVVALVRSQLELSVCRLLGPDADNDP